MHYENNKINNDEFEEYFKQLDIQLANIEKLGSSLLVIGYFFFFVCRHSSGVFQGNTVMVYAGCGQGDENDCQQNV